MFVVRYFGKIGFSIIFGLFQVLSQAHDPVFSPGPHVLFKEGYEVHAEFTRDKQGPQETNTESVNIKYGITGDWVVGLSLPYQSDQSMGIKNSGVGDITLSSKYRFWRSDRPGIQETAAILAKVKLNSAGKNNGTETTDSLLGFTYGFESLKWYRWASIRYLFKQNLSTQNVGLLQRGDRLFIDFAGGYRHQINDYREADTVWLLELNGEYSQTNKINGLELANSGGSQWFVSPGVMWTLRNFAIKAGIQIPLSSNLKGMQAKTDYRALLEFEWHI